MPRPPRRQFAVGELVDAVAANADAALRGAVQAADEIEQGGFAGAGGAHEGKKLPLIDHEVEAREDRNVLRSAMEGLGDVLDLDECGVAHGWEILTLPPSVRPGGG